MYCMTFLAVSRFSPTCRVCHCGHVIPLAGPRSLCLWRGACGRRWGAQQPRLTALRPPALRAGAALLEVGAAAAAHGAVLPGGLRLLRGLHPRVGPQAPLERRARGPPAGGAGGRPHCEQPRAPSPSWGPWSSPSPCPAGTPLPPGSAVLLAPSASPVSPGVPPGAANPHRLPSPPRPAPRFGSSLTSSKHGRRSASRRRRSWNASPACL